MRLKIDTSNNRKLIVGVDKTELVKEYGSPNEQDLLGAIDELLTREKKSLADVSEIEVNSGPGAFTSLRVGISIANALGFGLRVPVNGKLGQAVRAEYGQPAKITEQKSKF